MVRIAKINNCGECPYKYSIPTEEVRFEPHYVCGLGFFTVSDLETISEKCVLEVL
jgi:hypothetical protein